MHPLKVASYFTPLTRHWWLALFHDSVEDGYMPRALLRVWPALDAITRRPGEVYQSEYIPRVAANSDAWLVKLADLAVNLERAPESLKKRYRRAINALLEA